jgi:hypothetical protein
MMIEFRDVAVFEGKIAKYLVQSSSSEGDNEPKRFFWAVNVDI